MKQDIRVTIKENMLKNIEGTESAHKAQVWVDVLKRFLDAMLVEQLLKEK